MKRITETTEASTFESLLGEQVLIFCVNYIYTGRLAAINETSLTLEKPQIVYETGAYSNAGYSDAQALHCSEWHVQLSAIESFGKSK